MNFLSIISVFIMLFGLAYAAKKKILISQMIVVINFIIFFLLILTSHGFSTAYSPIFSDLAFKPSYLEDITHVHTLFTSIFVHGDIFHILMNMIVFLLVGIPFEQRVGSRKFAAIYFATGIFGAIFFSIFNWGSNIMLVGASGAIFGILGAFAALYPRDEVVMPIPFPIILFIRMPVVVATLLFASMESIYTFSGISDGVAHLAHIGGIISGILLSISIRKKADHERPAGVNFNVLETLIHNEEQREIFEKIKESDVSEVREAWLSYLVKKLKCPKCGGKLVGGKGIHCKNCGYKIM
ncbi:MAG: rhomboid family intramembrane serine protease [Candidatus Thermoplasmatota archaeon]|nr:rhomboid family intramembrane serine protease [Candidatus Thermoplasmatota archaeon]